jgi:hypothetical protein
LLSCLCETTPAKAVQVVVSATFAFTYLCTVKHCETLFLSATYFCGLYSGGLVFVQHLEMQAPTMSIRLSDPDLWTDKVPSIVSCRAKQSHWTSNDCNEIVHRTSSIIIVHHRTSSYIGNPPLRIMNEMFATFGDFNKNLWRARFTNRQTEGWRWPLSSISGASWSR